jgi:hypothetical protein
MALRKSPTGRMQRERLRMSKLLLSADESNSNKIIYQPSVTIYNI